MVPLKFLSNWHSSNISNIVRDDYLQTIVLQFFFFNFHRRALASACALKQANFSSGVM